MTEQRGGRKLLAPTVLCVRKDRNFAPRAKSITLMPTYGSKHDLKRMKKNGELRNKVLWKGRDREVSSGILAIDVGGGTQDILLFEEGKTIENCVKLVLPSQTVVVAKRIAKATAAGKTVFLLGSLMGGGACVGAIKRHLAQGLKVYATPDAALTINDDLKRVETLGITITANPPSDVVEIHMRDIDLEAIGTALARFEVELPEHFAIAVQDHGESIGQSNRDFRFQQWRKFVERGGQIEALAYFDVPFHYTRMRSVQKSLPGALVMDTGSAAIWGALCDERVQQHAESGVTIVNIGNQHTVGILLKGERVYGIFEHHTGLLDKDRLISYIKALQNGTLTHQEVYDSKGHGAFIGADSADHRFGGLTVVTGPNRNLLEGEDVYYAAPFGDMMLTGSFGLVKAYRQLRVRG